MTDLAFAKYLAVKLLNSGEDCCKMCALNKRDGVCDNQMLAEEAGGRASFDICFAGLRCYAESDRKDKGQAKVKSGKKRD